jgi:predicted PurR-regulated permease PerM
MKNPDARIHLWPSGHRNIKTLPTLFAFGNVVLIVGSLYWAQTFLIPIALAIMLTFLLSPVAAALERKGMGRLPSIFLIVVLAFSLITSVGFVVFREFTNLANELPKYTGNIRQKIADVRGAGKGGALENVQRTIEEVKEEIQKKEQPVKQQETPRPVVLEPKESSRFWPIPLISSAMLEPLAAAGFVIVLVIFMLIQREDLRNRLIHFFGDGRLTVITRAMEEAGQRISRYLLMQTIINCSFGLSVGLTLFLIGVPYSVLWGFFAAVLRFIPYVGPLMAVVMPSALSLAVFEGWLWPLLVIGVFAALELTCNLVLEPLLYSESAGVTGVGLLIAIAFWTWIWGPVGLILATPLTVCVVVLGKYVPGMDFISVLIGDQPALESHVTYYQRLIAMDQAEATEIVEEYLETHPEDELFDKVLIPALHYVRRDRELGRLTEDSEQFFLRATREIVEDLENFKPTTDLPETSDSAHVATSEDYPTLSHAKIIIVGCPAQDEVDGVALLMFRRLLDRNKYDVDVISSAMLTAEVVARIGASGSPVVCIAAVPPGGLAQTRYLCKRIRMRFPNLKIIVGRWGTGSEEDNTILLAGADKLGTTMVESRQQIIQLGQSSPHLDNKLSTSDSTLASA